MIENGKPVGVVLTMEEYELLRSKQLLIPEINSKPVVNPANPIGLPTKISEKISEGEAMIKEMDFPDLPADLSAKALASAEALAKTEASTDLNDINIADAGDVTLEDLGLDELPY